MKNHLRELAEDYIDAISEFQGYHEDPDWTGDPEAVTGGISALLSRLLEAWAFHSRTQKRWLNAEVHDNGNLIFLYAFDEGSDTGVHIGLSVDELYLEMDIARPGRLLQMPDDFWMQWLELHHWGQFEFAELETFPDKQIRRYPKLFKPNQGTLIPLMRSLLLFPVLNDGEMAPGKLSISWPFHMYRLNELFEMGNEAFSRMWHLNRRLAGRIPRKRSL